MYFEDDDNRTDVGDTVSGIADGDAGQAIKEDWEQTKEDAGDAKDAVENAAERAGVNDGDPNSDND
jgi:hypothetical protein